jgi:hypothetical protein
VLAQHSFEMHVVARLLDFFGSKTQWQRRLWGSGIILTLKEVLESTEAVRSAVLSTETLGEITNSAATLAGPDPGIGGPENRRALQLALKKTMVPNSVEFATVRLIITDLQKNYLSRWKAALAAAGPPGPERTARSIATHLLDAGFSPVHLHKWCTFHVKNPDGAKSLAELLTHADAMLQAPARTYKILVGFDRVPANKTGMPANWVSPTQTSQWLHAHGIQASGARFNGAMLFHVPARDSWAAIQAAVETTDQLTSRVALGTDSSLRPSGKAWIDGNKETFSFRRDPRLVEIHALHREDKLYSEGTNNIVDAAFELLGALNSGPGSSAVAAGWAAVEALLSGPSDQDVVAAERLASLVACAFVRAELTFLSYQLEKEGGELAARLHACPTNRDRAGVVAESIISGTVVNAADDSDTAAIGRMKRVLADPFACLQDVQHHVAIAFRRLYRIRNLVLHGGKTDAVGLPVTLRTAAPLVGAGMDRIAHAWFVEGVHPMELAARAQVGLATVGTRDGPDPVDLLA